jgi:hypothetical protein
MRAAGKEAGSTSHVLQLGATDFADTRASGTKLCRTLCITHTTIGVSGSDLRGFSESKTLHYEEKLLLFHSFYQEMVSLGIRSCRCGCL